MVHKLPYQRLLVVGKLEQSSEVGRRLGQHEKIRSNNLVASDPLRPHVHYLMGLSRSDHLCREQVELGWRQRGTEVDDNVVVQTFARVLGNLHEASLCWLYEVNDWQVRDAFAFLIEIKMQHNVAVTKAADLHDWRDGLQSMFVEHKGFEGE